jgi:hypothetical protein
MLARALVPVLCLTLAACATKPPKPSGFLGSYAGLQDKEALRAGMMVRRDPAALAQVRKVSIAPSVIAPNVDVAWIGEKERPLILREMDAQLCFELSERYEIAPEPTTDAAIVRAAITRVKPTGTAGSAASAVVGIFIPGPVGVRMPGETGGLAAEAEMLSGGKQVAAIIWSRKANVVGTDNPSFSEVGDALQFMEPFADAVGKTFEPDKVEKKKIEAETDPCARYGPRMRPEGFLAKLATGVYVPELSAAKVEEKPAEPDRKP